MTVRLRFFLEGNGANWIALPLPDEHLGFWRSLDEDALCLMARCLVRSSKEELPEGIIADLMVWGDEPWVEIGGPDLSGELTLGIEGYEDEHADTAEFTNHLARRLRQPSISHFERPVGRTSLVYAEYERARYWYDLDSSSRFDATALSFDIRGAPSLKSSDVNGDEHLLIYGIAYEDGTLTESMDRFRDCGRRACLVMF